MSRKWKARLQPVHRQNEILRDRCEGRPEIELTFTERVTNSGGSHNNTQFTHEVSQVALGKNSTTQIGDNSISRNVCSVYWSKRTPSEDGQASRDPVLCIKGYDRNSRFFINGKLQTGDPMGCVARPLHDGDLIGLGVPPNLLPTADGAGGMTTRTRSGRKLSCGSTNGQDNAVFYYEYKVHLEPPTQSPAASIAAAAAMNAPHRYSLRHMVAAAGNTASNRTTASATKAPRASPLVAARKTEAKQSAQAALLRAAQSSARSRAASQQSITVARASTAVIHAKVDSDSPSSSHSGSASTRTAASLKRPASECLVSLESDDEDEDQPRKIRAVNRGRRTNISHIQARELLKIKSEDNEETSIKAEPTGESSTQTIETKGAAASAGDELMCPCCLEVLVRTSTLVPCGHVFCKPCIDDTQECPSCREPFTLTVPCRSMDNAIAAIINNVQLRELFFKADDIEHYHARMAANEKVQSGKPARPVPVNTSSTSQATHIAAPFPTTSSLVLPARAGLPPIASFERVAVPFEFVIRRPKRAKQSQLIDLSDAPTTGGSRVLNVEGTSGASKDSAIMID